MKHTSATKRRRWPARVTFLTAGSLAAVTAGAGSPAHANTPPAPRAAAPGTLLSVHRFEIPGGSLIPALEAWEQASQMKIEFSLPFATLAAFDSPGISGVLPAGDALNRLLADSGLTVRVLAQGTVSLGLQTSAEIQVIAQQSMPLSSFTESLTDTPQSIAVVPKHVLDEQAVTTLRDALRNVPGISLAAGEAGAQGDNLTIRGFTARNDIFLDGIRDFGSYYRDSFNYEQVEVLEGPAGIEFGRGSTGGVINQESKLPRENKAVSGTLLLGTDVTRRGTLDINQPLGKIAGGEVAFRLNLIGEAANVAGRDVVANRRLGIAPSLAFGMGTATRATLSYVHLNADDTPDYGLPWLLNKPSRAVRSAYYGFRQGNFINTHDDIFTLRLDHDVNEHLSFRSLTRFANYPRNAVITEPQVCSNGAISATTGKLLAPTSSLNSALLCPYNQSTDPSTILVNRNQIAVRSVENDLWQQASALIHVKLGHTTQSIVVGAEGGREMSNPTRFTFSGVPSATLVNPNENLAFTGTRNLNTVTHVAADSGGLYLIDTLNLSRYFSLTGGIRYDYFYTQQRQYTASTAANVFLHRIDRKPTYRGAFVFKPSTHGSVYFDFGTSFNPSAESLSLSASNSVLPPEENETYEVGSKWDLMRDRLNLAGSVFRTVKKNARETSPANALLTVLAGNQEVKGIQLSATGRLRNNFDILAGYAYLQSEVISSQFFPMAIGAPLANVPRQTFNAWLTHNLGYRVLGGFGGNYVASRSASSTIPYVATAWTGTTPANAVVTATALKQIPSYWAFNALLKRPIGERFELQANIDNLFNRFYIDQPHPSHLVPGPGRTALFGLNYKF